MLCGSIYSQRSTPETLDDQSVVHYLETKWKPPRFANTFDSLKYAGFFFHLDLPSSSLRCICSVVSNFIIPLIVSQIFRFRLFADLNISAREPHTDLHKINVTILSKDAQNVQSLPQKLQLMKTANESMKNSAYPRFA